MKKQQFFGGSKLVNKKLKIFDILYIVGVVVFVLLSLFMPKAGELALLHVTFNNFTLWGILIYLVVKVRKFNGGWRKNFYVYLICLFLGIFSIWSTKDLVMDLVSGVQEVELYNVKVSEIQGPKGLILHHYYVDGNDAVGNRYRIEISGNDYEKLNSRYNYRNLNSKDSVVLTIYKYTEKLYQIGGIQKELTE